MMDVRVRDRKCEKVLPLIKSHHVKNKSKGLFEFMSALYYQKRNKTNSTEHESQDWP